MQIEVRKAEMGKEKKRLKVCAYARVSTEASEQENSLENQVSHYTEMIQANPAYEFAGVYADFGISGFKESRPQFLKMMPLPEGFSFSAESCHPLYKADSLV